MTFPDPQNWHMRGPEVESAATHTVRLPLWATGFKEFPLQCLRWEMADKLA